MAQAEKAQGLGALAEVSERTIEQLAGRTVILGPTAAIPASSHRQALHRPVAGGRPLALQKSPWA